MDGVWRPSSITSCLHAASAQDPIESSKRGPALLCDSALQAPPLDCLAFDGAENQVFDDQPDDDYSQQSGKYCRDVEQISVLEYKPAKATFARRDSKYQFAAIRCARQRPNRPSDPSELQGKRPAQGCARHKECPSSRSYVLPCARFAIHPRTRRGYSGPLPITPSVISTNTRLPAPRPNQSSASGSKAIAGRGLNIAVIVSRKSVPICVPIASTVNNAASEIPAA